MSLDEIAIKYGTDKSSLSHNYCVLYEKHLPDRVDNFLEIGVLKGGGIRMFKEWYNHHGNFYALDRFLAGHGLATVSELQADGIHSFIGSQIDLGFLSAIDIKFDVISEDASHHWYDQIVTFKQMFVNNLTSGGVYVVEDVFDDLYWGQGVVKDKKDNIKGIFNKYLIGGSIESQLVTKQESDIICQMVDEVNIYSEIIFIKKK